MQPIEHHGARGTEKALHLHPFLAGNPAGAVHVKFVDAGGELVAQGQNALFCGGGIRGGYVNLESGARFFAVRDDATQAIYHMGKDIKTMRCCIVVRLPCIDGKFE